MESTENITPTPDALPVYEEVKPKSVAYILVYPVLFVAVMWLVWLVDLEFGLNLNQFGVRPREVEGLIGIFTMPFLHSGLEHLFGNSVPMLVLGGLIFYFYKPAAWRIFLWSWLITGLWVWAAARAGTNHIGASGLVYAFSSFVFFSGLIRRNYRMLALSMMIVFLYGSMFWGILPLDFDPFLNTSWEGHLFGGVAGLLLAINFRKLGPQRQRYAWEFEEDEEEEEVEWDDWKHPQPPPKPGQRQIAVRYIYRPKRVQRRPPDQGQQSNDNSEPQKGE